MSFPDLPHLKQLQKEIWRWPKSRAAVMVGAGFSLNSEPLPGVTKGFPTWRQLVRVMFDELSASADEDTGQQAGVREARFNSSNALRIASEYEAAFGKPKLDLLIYSQHPDADHQPGKLHQLLLQLPWADVFTTNYDTLLERTDVRGRTYQPVTKASELTAAFAPRIVKLHGSFPSQTPFIISEEDYRKYPRDFAPFVNSVQQSLLENSFVLLGFSGDDPNFLEWTGWIRDELGGNHAPIYLVGPLSLGNAGRLLLSRRGVTPIDLSPVFAGNEPPNGVHAASIEWFLNNLLSARPPHPEEWPKFERSATFVSFPPISNAGTEVPQTVGQTPDLQRPLTAEGVSKLVTRWRYERLNYPGWIVLPENMRSRLWEQTKYWIAPLIAFSEAWPATDRLLLFREINWRFETAMTPLFTQWWEPFQKVIEELASPLASGASFPPIAHLTSIAPVPTSEVADAWLGMAFGLLREARETYNQERWNLLKASIDPVVQRNPKHSDRNQYEAALWAMWNVDRKSAKMIVSQWQTSPRSPLAAMWKASLLAEMDEIGEARTNLRSALAEIRRALRSQGRNIELLSLEGWCTYLLFPVEVSSLFSAYGTLRDEFWERWQELKAWDCNPWPHKEYFDKVLAGPVPQLQDPDEEQEVRDFDPGQVTISHSWRDDRISPFFPGFACIRLYEQVGIPMRLPGVNISGDTLQHACRWISPFIGFWSAALLVRAGKLQDLKIGGFLNRTQVAAMEQALANRLYLWCLQILEWELPSLTNGIVPHSAQEDLVGILPEILSRLAFRMDTTELRRTFPLALQFYRQPAVRSHLTLHRSCAPWFRRLFEAAEDKVLLEWLPALIRAPLFDEGGHPLIPVDRAWPDPMAHFPTERGRRAKDAWPDLVQKIQEATDWLLRRAESEVGEGRRRALNRLVDVYHANMMTEEQQRNFGRLLWEQRTPNGLPALPNFALFGFLHLPAPKDIDVPSTIKHHILSLSPRGATTKDAQGHISVSLESRNQPLIYEVSLATKSLIQVAGEPMGTIEWTPEESKQLYLKSRDWWTQDKVLLSKNQAHLMGSSNPVLSTLGQLVPFLARAVIPKVDFGEEDWQSLSEWVQEIRQLGFFPTAVLPYIVLRRPNEAHLAERTIRNDLCLETRDAVAAAAKATRHWILLSSIEHVSAPSAELTTALVDRVVFRRKTDINECLLHLAHLIVEKPEAITPLQAALLASSLVPWHEVTRLPVHGDASGEFHEAERPDLRSLIANLAGALRKWQKKLAPQNPEPSSIKLWHDVCAADPLPEIRRAFAAWD